MSIKLEAILTASDRATGVIKSASAAAISLNDRALKGLSSLDEMTSRIGAGIKTTVATLSVAGVALGGVGANVISTGADFEQAITNVGAVSLVTRDQIADLEKKALELGASTKFSATEVAGAMEMMGRAGFTNAEVLSGVGGILSAAAAEGSGLEETASNVSNVLKGMGLATSEAGRVADVLTLASARTNSSISSLGESMKNTASTARTFGVSFEDTVAAVALLQDIGLDASEAGSSLNTMLTMMAAPSDEVQKQMKKLGVSFRDAKGNMLPFESVLQQLSNSAKKSGGNMDQVAFFADLLGMRGSKAAGNLKDLFNEGKVSALKAELDGAAGSAGRMADLRMDTLRGDWEQLGGAVDSVKISLFSLEAGPLRGVVQATTKWIDANKELVSAGVGETLTEWLPIVQNFGSGVSDALEDVAPVVRVLSHEFKELFVENGESARAEAYSLGGTVTNLGLAFVGFTVATKLATFAVWTYQGVVKTARVAVIAYEGAVKLVRAAIVAYEMWTKAGTVSTIALSFAQKAAAVDSLLLAGRTQIAAMGMRGLAGAAGAAAAAVAGVMLAVDQAGKFLDENGGWEGAAGFLGIGTDDWGFEGVDQAMNNQAKAEAAKREEKPPGSSIEDVVGLGAQSSAAGDVMGSYGLPAEQDAQLRSQLGLLYTPTPAFAASPPSVVPPAVPQQQGPSRAEFRDMMKQSIELKVTAAEGTTAEVTKKPEGAKVKVAPTGSPAQ
jgi:TP901 family phage tail tape measure protein